MNKKTTEILNKMTLDQKIGQCVVVGMSGTTITNDLKEAITRYHCSGIRLSPFLRIFKYFSDDRAKPQHLGQDYRPSMQKIAQQGLPAYYSPPEYTRMLNELKELAAQRDPAIPLHMVIDQEGDTSKDYTRGGVIQFPSNMGLAAGGDPELAYRVAKAIGKQMKAAGLDMIHSPVVDVNINPDNPEIGRRAFSDDPQIVAEYAIAMVKGFQEEGVIAAAKHFPGRGDSATDAHHSCPSLDVDRQRFYDIELYPYKQLIAAGIDSIMVAHCLYPMIDPDLISTVSPKIVTDLLRNELGFKGLITTDSITMGALIDQYGIGESCARALSAGADLILMKAENQWRGEMFYTIKKWVIDGKITEKEINAKVERILDMKLKYGLFDQYGKVNPAKTTAPFHDPAIIQLSKEAAQKAIIIAKDDLKCLPLDKNKKTLLINQINTIKTPNDSYDHPSLFSQLMEEDWPELQTYETDFGFNEAEENKILQFVESDQYDLIICTNFYDRSAKPHTYVKELINRNYPVLLITNTPYFIKQQGGLIPQASSIILNMNLTPEGLRTMRDVLYGKKEARGKWPLSNYNPLNLVIKENKSL